MQTVLNAMLAKYDIKSLQDKKNALKEIVQEIVLCGLSRSDFFKEAAFCGGTALRIFYNLDRFSEDLDFSLLNPNSNFDLTKYFSFIENETNSLGLNFLVSKKEKSSNSNIESAFLKGNTLEHILTFFKKDTDISKINKEELIKIKFEVDVNPPKYATFETKTRLLPSPYQTYLYDTASLFAGKIHACLCRNWMSRIKGRDFYDYVFFLSINAPVNLKNLKEKLVQSNFIDDKYDLTIDNLKDLLNKRFDEINFNQAKNDVIPFIKDKRKIDLWNAEFFKEITKNIRPY